MGVRAPATNTDGSSVCAVILLSFMSQPASPIPDSAYANISSMSAISGVTNEISHLILGIDHIGIAVPNLQESLAFYEGSLGLQCHHTEVNKEQGVEEAMLKFSEGKSEIQLLAPLGPDTTIGKFLAKQGPGIQQLAFSVKDVVEVARILQSRGVRMLYPEPRVGTAGSLVNFAHPRDCGGVLIEFVQHS
jgi:methylmalonyl-CoA/ethylmalonyl-CoA epimerase